MTIVIIILIGLIIYAGYQSKNKNKKDIQSPQTTNTSEDKTTSSSETLSTQSNVSSDNNLIKIQGHNFLINPSIFKLLYFTDGPLQNIDSDSEEPSAISCDLPINISDDFEKLGYYPSYEGCTPSQRYNYICWLGTDLAFIPDVGFAFILLDCLERHIVNNENVDQCIDLIVKLQSSIKNKSFSYYSTTSIAYAAFQFNRLDLVSKIDLSKCSPQFQVLLQNKLSADDLINFAKLVGFTNTRYIKRYPDIFKKALSENLTSRYGEPYFKYKFSDINNLSKTPLMFSNTSLNEPLILKGETLGIPDPFSSIDFDTDIYKILQMAHEQTKALLKLKRAADPVFAEKDKEIQKSRSNRKINLETGYPISTEKQIQYAKEEIDSAKDTLHYHEIELKDPMYREFHPLSTELDKIIDKNSYESRIPLTEAMYFYKCGEWDKAESKWLSCLFTGFEAADRLRIMYQKEKRFKDAVNILQLVLDSSFARAMAPQSIDEAEDKLKKAQQKAIKNEKTDKSKLTSLELNKLKDESSRLEDKYINK